MAKPDTVGERLAAARERAFVGRRAELAQFDAFVEGRLGNLVWFIVAAGGMGKTTLLQAFVRRAREGDRLCTIQDARNVPPNPPAVRNAIEQALEGALGRPAQVEEAAPLLLIDTFESWQALEPWFRDVFLPELPANLRLVIASRVEPETEWRTDPGWRELASITHLSPLSADQARDYLACRGLERSGREDVVAFADGHPLALVMAADTLLAGGSVDTVRAADSPVIRTLVDSFTREADDPIRRRALDACAVVRELSEDLLDRMLETEDGQALFDWLRGLSFIEQGAEGLFPHDQVREALMLEMPQRFPGRYEACALTAVDWVVERIARREDIVWSEATALAGDAMYALRELPVMRQVSSAAHTRSLYLDQPRANDASAMIEMIDQQQGSEARRWLEHWIEHAPHGLHVIRNENALVQGFFLKLDMEALAPAARQADPVTRRLWRFLQDELALRPGEHVPFIRLWATGYHTQEASPASLQILMAVSTYNLMSKNLRASAQLLIENPMWGELTRILGITAVTDGDIWTGEQHWRVYYQDWQKESPARHYQRFAKCVFALQKAAGHAELTSSAPRGLAEADFRHAVRRALKDYHSAGRLGRNPLLGEAFVLTRTERGDSVDERVHILRGQLEDAVAAAGRAGTGSQRLGEVLHRAYIAPATNQKAAAAALSMGYSTFRKQLSVAREALADELWHRELACRRD